MKELLFIRHGESITNITKEFSYNKVDKPLTDKGRLQAEQTGKFLNRQYRIDQIFTSPLLRTVETAEIINAQFDDKTMIKEFEPIREINVGILEDMGATKDAWDIFFHTIEKWETDQNFSFPKGESLNDITQRLENGINSVINWMEKKNAETIILVSHGGILYSTLNILFSLENTIPDDFQVGNCSITNILVDTNSDWRIKQLTSVDHLFGEARKIEKGLPGKDHFKG